MKRHQRILILLLKPFGSIVFLQPSKCLAIFLTLGYLSRSWAILFASILQSSLHSVPWICVPSMFLQPSKCFAIFLTLGYLSRSWAILFSNVLQSSLHSITWICFPSIRILHARSCNLSIRLSLRPSKHLTIFLTLGKYTEFCTQRTIIEQTSLITCTNSSRNQTERQGKS